MLTLPGRVRRVAAAIAAPLALVALPLAGRASAAPADDGLESLLNQLTAQQGANYAVLIDTSGSMQTSGYYPRVLAVLPTFLDSLNSRDQVCLMTFDTSAGTCELVSATAARKQLAALPRRATGQASDFGRAFETALTTLGHSGTDTSGVVLLSDAKLNAPNDPKYKTYDSPGWAELRAQAASLPDSQSVTGYGIPFGPSSEVADVLGKVMPHKRILDPSGNGLTTALSQAHDQTRTRQAAQAVAADAGKGITVTWPGMTQDARLGDGSEIRIRLTANTAALPVTVTGLRLTGLPGNLRTTEPLPPVTLKPGRHEDVTVRLAGSDGKRAGWISQTSTRSWRVSADGTVTTPLADQITTYLGVTAHPAAAPTGTPLEATGTQHTTVSWPRWLLVLLLAAAAAAALLIRWLRRHQSLHGYLVAEAVDRPTPLRITLAGRGELTHNINQLVTGGTLLVKSLPGPRNSPPPVRLRCDLPGRPSREATCLPGNRVLLCGIEFHYDTTPS